MNFRIEEALLYPFRNWVTCMLIPGLVVYVDIILVVVIVIVLAILLAILFPAMMSSVSDVMPAIRLPLPNLHEFLPQNINLGELLRAEEGESYGSGGGSGGGGLGQQWNGPLYLIFWMGFQWQLFAQWQKHGYDAPPPDFEKSFGSWFLDGLKGGAFYIPLNIVLFLPLLIVIGIAIATIAPHIQESAPPPEFFALIPLFLGTLLVYGLLSFFLSPFLIAPMIHSAQNRSIRELYDIRKAIEITLPRYWEVIVSFLLILALWCVYFIGSFLLLLVTCCLGVFLFPFIWEGAFRASAAHLIAQGFDYQPAGTPVSGAANPPSGEAGSNPPEETPPGTDPTGVRKRY